MSCRVLGRCVETLVLRQLLLGASRRRIQTIIGTYIPSDRNKMVQEHYPKLGFQLAGKLLDGSTVWKLDVSGTTVAGDIPMTIHSFLP